MNKKIRTLACTTLLLGLASPALVQAAPGSIAHHSVTADGVEHLQIHGIWVGSGVTEDGIHFDVFKPATIHAAEPEFTLGRQVGYTMSVTRHAMFSGATRPPETLAWSELINGMVWTGTLRLQSIQDMQPINGTNAVQGIYSGTLRTSGSIF